MDNKSLTMQLFLGLAILLSYTPLKAKNDYAYLYSTQARTINLGASIFFDINGYITSDIAHSPGSSNIKFEKKGTYKITFSISCVQPNQIAVYKNNTMCAGSIFGSGNRIQQNTGSIILDINKNDVISIRNISSTALNLQTLAGGPNANVNAYIIIEELDA
jgi:hypothetical protein